MNKQDKSTAEELPYQAVFAGLRGAVWGETCGMPFVYSSKLYFDSDGNPIPITAELVGKDPEEIPGFVSTRVVSFGIGDDVVLPVWSPKKYQLALSTGEFARPEAKDLIVKAHKAALDASNKSGLDFTYKERVAKLKQDLLDQDLIMLPDSGNLQEIKYEGS